MFVTLLTLPWQAGAELPCPLREDWDNQRLEQWIKDESNDSSWGFQECPCERGWEPTESQLKGIQDFGRTLFQKDRKNFETGMGLAELFASRILLCESSLKNADLAGSVLAPVDFQGADLTGANLEGAILIDSDFNGAQLKNAIFKGAYIYGFMRITNADLTEANLKGIRGGHLNARGANLRSANLEGAYLTGAFFRNANLNGANVRGALLAGADLTGAVYAPLSAPPNKHLGGLTGLSTTLFPPEEQTGLVELRELLRETGQRDLEREATYAIEHNKVDHALCMLTYQQRLLDIERERHLMRAQREQNFNEEEIDGLYKKRYDTFKQKCLKQRSFATQLGGWIKLILFESPTKWGMHPERALLFILGGIVICSFVYTAAIWDPPREKWNKSGVWTVTREEQYDSPEGWKDTEKVHLERLWKPNGFSALRSGLWFSILSAFHIGWRDLNVGTWLSRLQPNQYALQSRGWVRIVSGAQSLISVYFLAMWALTYFGRPFQ